MSSRFDPEDPGLHIETRREGAATVVATRGEVTVFTSPALRESLRQVADERPPLVVLDLSETRYIDSSGVATLVEALQAVRRHQGRLVLAGINDRVRGVFEIARLDSIFPMVASVGEALKS